MSTSPAACPMMRTASAAREVIGDQSCDPINVGATTQLPPTAKIAGWARRRGCRLRPAVGRNLTSWNGLAN
jgi:hypothetical protein